MKSIKSFATAFGRNSVKFFPYSFSVLFLIFISVSLLISCSDSKLSKDVKELEGIIVITGNEPFTHPSVKTDEGKIYVIECENKERKLFFENQGKRFKIFFNEIKDGPFGKTINLTDYKKL